MADKPFRVLLDLTDLHIESLKYVWTNVSPQELKTIADFKTSVRHKINLEKEDIKLFVRNGLLLDNETVMILREDDTVKVQYESQYHPGYNDTENSVREIRMSSRKRNHSESHNDLSISAKRCKTGSKSLTQGNEEICFEMSNKKKKKKHKEFHSMCSENLLNQSETLGTNDHDAVKIQKKNDEKQITPLEKNKTVFSLHQNFDPFFSFDNQDKTIEENENNTSKTDINVGSSSCLKFNSTENSLSKNDCSLDQDKGLKKPPVINTEILKKSEGLGNNCPKKKRKRHKKRKQTLQNVIDACDNTDINNEFKSFINENNESAQRKHIVYSSSPCKEQESIQLDCNSKNEKAKNLPTDTFVMDTNVSNVTVETSHNYPKISTPAQLNYCENPNWSFTVMQKANLNSHYNETAGIKKGENKSCVLTKSANEWNVSYECSKKGEEPPGLKYTYLPSLNSRPDIGTHIAYKILELDEHYSPVISDYREGIVKNVNDNEEMEIELLKHVIKPGRTGKFENLKEDEMPPPEIKRCDFVKWSSLVEPKLINC